MYGGVLISGSVLIHKSGPTHENVGAAAKSFAESGRLVFWSRERIGSQFTRVDALPDLSWPTNGADMLIYSHNTVLFDVTIVTCKNEIEMMR